MTRPVGPIASGIGGKCADDYTVSSANGTRLDIWTCTGGANQQWNLPS